MYIETTIVIYLTARRSRELTKRANQQLTRQWWRARRAQFDLYVSQPVVQEAADGDPNWARRRLVSLKGIPILESTPDAMRLAEALVGMSLPALPVADATHIAIATVHGMAYLVTWNPTLLLANAAMRSRIESICRRVGFEPPILCTPGSLMED